MTVLCVYLVSNCLLVSLIISSNEITGTTKDMSDDHAFWQPLIVGIRSVVKERNTVVDIHNF